LGPDRLRCIPHEVVLDGQPDPFADDDPRTAEQRGLDWMDAMRPTALGLLHISIEHCWFDEAWQLAESMTALFAVRRYLVDWTEFSELGARAARAAGNAAAEARLRSFASRAWADLGDLPVARREMDAAFALAESLAHPILVASIWEMEGRYRDDVGQHGDAVAAYERSVALFDQADAPRGVAFVTSFIGASLLAQGDPRQAAAVLARARELIHAVGNDRMEGEALTTLGIAQHQLGEHDAARGTLLAAVGLLGAGRYRYQEACAHEALATVAADSGAAIGSLLAAVTIHAELHSPRLAQVRDRLVVLSRGDESSSDAAPGPSTP
jgi:tetratricopeptide (TPR) repeat protein